VGRSLTPNLYLARFPGY